LWGYAEGLSVVGVNRPKMLRWLDGLPGVLQDTGDVPVYKRRDGYFRED
jgi:toxic protein SymE